jgi:uncharacterized protein (DUF697 family)/uncharacterized tellurite resistance protein B-like protein
MSKEQLKSEMSAKLSEGFFSSVNNVISERERFYVDNPQRRPTPVSVPSVMDKYKYLNAGIVGALNLIPGPFGMLAVVPELLAVIRNQLKMVYDIGAAYGQEKQMTPELLIGVFAAATMGGGLGLLVMQGQKVLVKRASLRVLQKIIAKLAGNITQRALKQLLAKWLPGIGAVAMATWAGYTTQKIGQKAVEIFSRAIEISPDAAQDDADPSEGAPSSPKRLTSDALADEADAQQRKDRRRSYATCLINLMNIDGHRHTKELEFIEHIIQRSDLDPQTAASIRDLTHSTTLYPVQYAPLMEAETSQQLLIDMVALANRDGELHETERQYILKVGQQLGYAADTLTDMMDFSPPANLT